MDTKLPIFILIGSILAMAVYSSSINFAFAKSDIKVTFSSACGEDGHGGLVCSILDKKGNYTNWSCKLENGKWNCTKIRTSSGTPNQMPGSETLSKMTDSQIPLGVRNALDSAIKNQNSGLVMGQNNTQVTNSSESTINNSPNPPQCPTTGPIPPDCTMKPPLK